MHLLNFGNTVIRGKLPSHIAHLFQLNIQLHSIPKRKSSQGEEEEEREKK